MKITQFTIKVPVISLLVLLIWSCTPVAKENSLLQDYVLADDPDFKYEVAYKAKEGTYTYYVIRMTSQQWLTTKEVNETVWWHWVTMIVPDNYSYNTALMWINGGSKNKAMPEKPDGLILAVAEATQSVVAQVHNIPFQPLAFKDDSLNNRNEDAIIAYGWRKFMEGGAKDEDVKWLSRMPMTNAVVAAMDVVQEVIKKNNYPKIDNFVVGGASKRGWTTWTTGAVDKRVVAIVPVVIDVLNVIPSFDHHWRSYGFWSPAVDDYVNEGIMDWMGSKEYDRLLEIVEPYSYKEKYTMPKLLINASGDQFFLPDSWKFYYNDLPGEKHLMYVPNSGHDVSKSDAIQNLNSFYTSILDKIPRPEYEWEIVGDAFKMQTEISNAPTSIKLWQAHNPETRDFRIDVFGPNWTSTDIPISDDGKYEVPLSTPEKGWKGYFVEITYPGKIPFKVTTGVEVLPRTEPFGPYVSPHPYGTRK